MAKTVTIGSAAFKNIFLRLDGTGVTQPTGPGGGVANAQFGPGPMQQFRLEDQADGSVAIASVAFPKVYLRLDGRGITAPGNGGVVNAQFGVHGRNSSSSRKTTAISASCRENSRTSICASTAPASPPPCRRAAAR